MVNLPAFFTSVVASEAKSSSTFETSDFFKPLFAARLKREQKYQIRSTSKSFLSPSQ